MQNWEYKKLGDLSAEKMSYGTSAPSCEFNGKVRYIRITDINDDGYLNDEYVSPETYEEKHVLQDGDIVFARTGATVGKAYCYHSSEEKYVYAGYLIRLRPNKNLVNSDYLFYCTKSNEYLEFIRTSQAAAAQPNVNAEKYSNFEIPLPPLEEQKRIVSILDRKFAMLETVKENAKTNLQNAKDLFQSQLTKAFGNTTWEKKRLVEVCNIINGYAFPSKDFSSKNPIKSVKITNVGVGEFIEEESEKLPKSYETTRKDVMVYANNLVVALTRTIISGGLKIAFVPESFNRALVNQRVAGLIPDEKIIYSKLLFNYFKTDIAYKYVLEHVNTLMQPNLSISDLRSFPIPLPPLTEQKRIVEQLDSFSAKVRRLEEIYTKQLADCDELKQAFLAKAFNGEL